MELTRRSLVTALGATAVVGAGCVSRAPVAPQPSSDGYGPGQPLAPEHRWQTALARSLPTERDYAPRIEGTLPADLEGRLFRNGPGLFERAGHRKRSLLDSDGMIQCFDFAGGRVRYRNRFVRTEKYLQEEAAGEWLYPTWTTPLPGGPLANLGAPNKSQAGVAALIRDGRLLAMDEGVPEAFYEMDPDTLQTLGPLALPDGLELRRLKPHTRTDPRTGDWHVVTNDYGLRGMTIRWQVLGRDGAVKAEGTVNSPRMTYFHDFLATERHLLFVLHPVKFSPLGMLAGLRTFADSLRWEPERGNLILVQDKAGGEPLMFEAPAAWMWHALNAYERDGVVVADFVGYDVPDHFLGPNPAFAAVTRGEAGDSAYPGKVRRYVMNLRANALRQEIVDSGAHELPAVDPRVALSEHRMGYFACGHVGDWVTDGVARLDMLSGTRDEFRFGPRHYAGEPVFAPRGGSRDDGWILTLVQSGDTGNGFLAVLDAANLAAGPLARVHLEHHTPISFHGCWQARA